MQRSVDLLAGFVNPIVIVKPLTPAELFLAEFQRNVAQEKRLFETTSRKTQAKEKRQQRRKKR